jgi:hypothetical protein
MQTQIAIAIRLEDPDAEPETVTLTPSEPEPKTPFGLSGPGEYYAMVAQKRAELGLKHGEPWPGSEPFCHQPRHDTLKTFGHLARFVALNRQLDSRDVLPHHDTNPKGRIAPFWTWCACGQTHRLEYDCPRCGPQKPETD